jgi:hypothetical protein
MAAKLWYDAPNSHLVGGPYIYAVAEHTYLLVFDNVDTIQAVSQYLPSGGRGSVIFTTRNQNIIHSPISASLHLKCFDLDEGREFLLSNILPSAKDPDHDKNKLEAELICKACGGLPLALSQLTRLISTASISLSRAKDRFGTPQIFVDAGSDLNRISQPDFYHQVGLPFLWDESLQSLNASCADIMRRLAYLDADEIPEELVRSVSKRRHQDQGRAHQDLSERYTLITCYILVIES